MANNSDIKISGEPTLDPNVCKFVVNQTLFEEGSFTCRDAEMAKGSPLLEALFSVAGVSQVMVAGDTLTIAKNCTQPWPALGQSIGEAIRNTIASGERLIAKDVKSKAPSEEAIRQKIEELFANNINPSIASHGGRVELVDVEGTRVLVRLGGGCQGCSSANVTLKHGIEQAIRQLLPDVTEVVDVTDHASGVDPFYK